MWWTFEVFFPIPSCVLISSSCLRNSAFCSCRILFCSLKALIISALTSWETLSTQSTFDPADFGFTWVPQPLSWGSLRWSPCVLSDCSRGKDFEQPLEWLWILDLLNERFWNSPSCCAVDFPRQPWNVLLASLLPLPASFPTVASWQCRVFGKVTCTSCPRLRDPCHTVEPTSKPEPEPKTPQASSPPPLKKKMAKETEDGKITEREM